ncbi:MAG: SUF system Fe-S cluster assembly protein [Gammaproteobacteria bacterium]|nr:SUF system Fe-S cluster assembly protein [Gammaproteobacteria bacterium]
MSVRGFLDKFRKGGKARDFPTPATRLPSREALVAAIRTIYDPEIPVNIYDLGLIYRIDIEDDGGVSIDMTLTAPACPVAGILPGEVRSVVAGVPGVTHAQVNLVWDPPWTRESMSEEAQLQLGLW